MAARGMLSSRRIVPASLQLRASAQGGAGKGKIELAPVGKLTSTSYEFKGLLAGPAVNLRIVEMFQGTEARASVRSVATTSLRSEDVQVPAAVNPPEDTARISAIKSWTRSQYPIVNNTTALSKATKEELGVLGEDVALLCYLIR